MKGRRLMVGDTEEPVFAKCACEFAELLHPETDNGVVASSLTRNPHDPRHLHHKSTGKQNIRLVIVKTGTVEKETTNSYTNNKPGY